MDFFDAEGINYKTIEIPEYTEVDGGKFIVRQMKAVNHVDDCSSEIVMKEVNSGSSVKDDLFLVTNLGR
ncbi:MAG: outer membrane lipoprotein-sorting protein [Bacteroidales bacterium]